MSTNNRNTYPEINALPLAEIDGALQLAYANLDAVRAELRPDLENRIAALLDRRRRLNRTASTIARTTAAIRRNARRQEHTR